VNAPASPLRVPYRAEIEVGPPQPEDPVAVESFWSLALQLVRAWRAPAES
jgi:hypothetical protein